ncbi:MAG: response regulator transcription factor [Planctomycetota bacterium]|jgi:FixJ family two-component response regulator
MKNITKQHIFFVDDEPKIREVVGETLEQLGSKVSCFARAADCLEQLDQQRCDLLITDLKMPGMNGVELLKEAKRLAPWLPVLVVTGFGDIPTAVKAVKAGAEDFIEKPLDKETFLHKVTSILQQSTSTYIFMDKSLTHSEMKVFKLVANGKSNREIADLLHRSIRTIEVHRAHLMQKLGVDTLVDLIKRSAEFGLADLETKPEPDETTRNSENQQ